MFETFEEFFRADKSCLVGFLITLGYPEDTADGAAMEAMVIACRDWATLRSPKAFVRKVARNEAEKLRKRAAKNDEAMANLLRIARNAVTDGPEEHWLLSEEAARVVNALSCLPKRRRLVMTLHLDGLSPTEIADAAGISEASVRSHLRNARKQLKNLHSVALMRTGRTSTPDPQPNLGVDS